MSQVLLSGTMRIVGFVPQAVATLIASRLILTHYGVESFASYALVISLIAMIPLNNLGVGASVTQAIAAYGARDERSVRTTLTAARVLSGSSLVLVAGAVALGMTDLWPRLLGHSAGSNTFTALAVVIYGASFVPGLAQSVLLGANHNHISILVTSFLAPVSLVVIGVLIAFDLDARGVLLAPALALLVVNLVTMLVSARLVRFPWLRVVARIPGRRRHPGQRIRSLSGPMLITSLCVPTAFVSDRIVLSHVSTDSAVADYSVVLQLSAPIMALIVAASQPLWPMYTRARALGERGPNLRKVFLAFGTVTLVCCVGLVVLADPVGRLIGGDRIQLGYFLPTVAALVLLVIAIAYPLSMSVVDPAGARFVATCAVITVPANIAMSIWLSKSMGAPGPLVSLLVVSTTLQVIPILLFVRRRERSGKKIDLFDRAGDDLAAEPVAEPAADQDDGLAAHASIT
jgi:O-antigen/teichoic acid export membrane protein